MVSPDVRGSRPAAFSCRHGELTVTVDRLDYYDVFVREGGEVLITSSVAAKMPGPHMSTYSASKAFLTSFGQALRQELSDTGVTVTVLMPARLVEST